MFQNKHCRTISQYRGQSWQRTRKPGSGYLVNSLVGPGRAKAQRQREAEAWPGYLSTAPSHCKCADGRSSDLSAAFMVTL